jgi:predicted membrane channel-forming protein YqfA (hemolysin III family)
MNETGRGIAIGLGLLAMVALACADDPAVWLRAVLFIFIGVIVIALTASLCKQAEEAIHASKHERGLSPTPDKK